MYSLFRYLGIHQTLRREGVPLGLAWFVAEVFYKFHSFTLECVAFLATWFVLSAILNKVLGVSPPGETVRPPSGT
jgi:hypothetical protein